VNSDERDSIAAQFGVPTEQVERDHLISHVLAFLSTTLGEQVQFIGGTALARTHLPGGRLSEDIDLIAIDDRKSVAATEWSGRLSDGRSCSATTTLPRPSC
jgi:predicted nucleotidyltransferase component of viral defense system